MFRLGIRSDLSIMDTGIIVTIDTGKLESNKANKGRAGISEVEEGEVVGDAVRRSALEGPEAGKARK